MQNSADMALLAKCCYSKTATDISSSYVKMRKDFSIQSDLFGTGVVAVDLFTNSVGSDEFASWEERITVSQPLNLLTGDF